jgi:hypothetical protein
LLAVLHQRRQLCSAKIELPGVQLSPNNPDISHL